LRAEYIDHMGSDNRVADAARVSFEKEASMFTEEQNGKLLSYLARNGHWSPFSHPQITLRYTVPIFVARQEFKHIVGFTRNEVSRRYVDDEPTFYVPDSLRKRPDGSVKQGSGGEHPSSDAYIGYIKEDAQRALNLYNMLIKDEVAPEQARTVLPQSMYTSYYVTGSLAAFARFYRQRTDSHAQQEIQDLAHMVGNIIKPLFPVSWSALTDD